MHGSLHIARGSGLTLFLGASLAPLQVEVGDHVVDNSLAPLKGDNDRVVLVLPLQLVRLHQYFDLLLVKYLPILLLESAQ